MPLVLRTACLAVLVLSATVTPVAGQPNVVGRWDSLQPLPFFPVHVHLLPTGKVMLWPGDEGISGNDPRLWDPATQAITTLAKPGYDLFCSGHSFLGDGRLLVTGGHILNNVGLSSASIYNPFSDTWTRLSNMNAGRWYPTNTTLGNGDVLVVAGDVDFTEGVNRLPQVFQAATETWRDLTGAQLALDLYPMMLLAPNGRVFNAGPSQVTRYLNTSGTGAWAAVANRNFGYRSYGSAVMYADGRVLIVGGGDPPTRTAEVIDLNQANPAWRTVASMGVARRHLNATLLPDGKVLVTGGTSGPGGNNVNTPVFAAEMWDPAGETWTTMASARIPRLYHSAALLLPDGRVLTTGGNNYPDAEVYSPPYLFKGARPMVTSTPSAVDYGQTMFVQTPDAASIAQVNWIRLGSVTHAFDQNQRINRLSFSPVSGGLNVIAPSSPNLAPPGHYMLFILNTIGVPSIARIVKLGSVASPPPPSTPTLAVSATTIPTSGVMTVTLSNGPGGAKDWLALAPLGSPNTTYLDWTYIGAGVTQRSWTPPTPGPGPYEFRLFLNDGFTGAAVSPTVTVTSANPATLTVNATTIPTTGAMTVTLSNAPGGAKDWLALAPVGSPNTTFSQWTYVGTGVTSRTWTPPTPAPGSYEFRFFLNDGFAREATSPIVTVTSAGSPALTVNATTIPPTGVMTATLSNGPGGAKDWLGLAPVGSPDTTFLQWTYVGAGVSTRTWTPATPGLGSYEFRLFLNDGFTRAATSPAVTVASSGSPALTVNATTISTTSTMTVTLTNGPGGATDWLGLAPVGSPDTTFLQWTYVGAGVGNRTWTPATPGPGSYQFRFFLNDGFTRAATSPTVTVSP